MGSVGIIVSLPSNKKKAWRTICLLKKLSRMPVNRPKKTKMRGYRVSGAQNGDENKMAPVLAKFDALFKPRKSQTFERF